MDEHWRNICELREQVSTLEAQRREHAALIEALEARLAALEARGDGEGERPATPGLGIPPVYGPGNPAPFSGVQRQQDQAERDLKRDAQRVTGGASGEGEEALLDALMSLIEEPTRKQLCGQEVSEVIAEHFRPVREALRAAEKERDEAREAAATWKEQHDRVEREYDEACRERDAAQHAYKTERDAKRDLEARLRDAESVTKYTTRLGDDVAHWAHQPLDDTDRAGGEAES